MSAPTATADVWRYRVDLWVAPDAVGVVLSDVWVLGYRTATEAVEAGARILEKQNSFQLVPEVGHAVGVSPLWVGAGTKNPLKTFVVRRYKNGETDEKWSLRGGLRRTR